ncbi:hypothetical protein AC578_4625 [Pseudocercospora eumusae]|uniref:tyrosinase n=1 Tax=Pseudocercospora eumusae TaxID=321146 RepID=A0A139GZD1_9PEZI|nr:hypothetical protein AC578_4625 [Pseudocercospora eumusae]
MQTRLFHQAIVFLWSVCIVLASQAPSLGAQQTDEIIGARAEDFLQPHHHHQQHQHLKEKRQTGSGSTPVTGIRNAGVAPRREIRDIANNSPDEFNLLLLGLTRWMAEPQKQHLSYYDVGSIHGRPYEPWDNVPPRDGQTSPGYCTHVSNLLLPWHRPYLALFEQTLYSHITAIVNEYPAGPMRQRFAKAAVTVRWPYWDFAATPKDGGSVWPEIITRETVPVIMPNGSATIKNPLMSYVFHPVIAADMYYAPFATWPETLRAPTSSALDAKSQNAKIAAQIDSQYLGWKSRIYNMLVYYNNFTQFSNEAWIQDHSNADSIEAIHDTLHGIIGSDGHMTYLDYSAYDAIFWLLHTNLDRLFAIYQVLHPNTWVEPMPAEVASYWFKVGDVMDANSPLEPFSKDTVGTKWTSNMVGSTEQFGYTYPETASKNADDVRRAVNQLYGGNAAAGGPMRKRDPLQAATHEEVEAAAGMMVDGNIRDYAANIISNKHALGRSYGIYVFVGDVDDSDPCSWGTSPNLAGVQAPFTSLSEGPDPSKPRVKISGTVPLTDTLLEKVKSGELKSMDEHDVGPYLKANLHWRVATFDHKPVPIENMPDLSVVVTMALIKPAEYENQFPERSEFRELEHITKGRPGGC